MNKTLIISTTIIICVVILGGIYYSVEINKQGTIEKQQAIDASQLEVCLNLAKEQHKSNESAALNYSNNECRNEFTQEDCVKGFLEALNKYEAEEKQSIDTCYTRFNK